MKIEDFAHRVANEALALLEKRYHYRISDDHKRDIQQSVLENLNELLESSESEQEKAKS